MAKVRRERADAARNRRAILSATEELLTRYPPEEISMERVAVEAGVGKGTVFHRFGDRMGLMVELMQERAFALHEQVDSGPPPLGPGAAPRERLLAFVDAVVDVVARNKGLLAALGHAQTTAHRSGGSRRDGHPIHELWHGHISELIAEARPDLDAELQAHILLGALNSEPILSLLHRGEGDRLAANLRVLTAALLDRRPSGVDEGRSER